MVQLLLLCMMLFQAGAQKATKPVIDNDRVSVLEVTNLSVAAQPTDAVVVTLSGIAAFMPKGTPRAISLAVAACL